MNQTPLLTLAAAAKRLSVSVSTVRKLAWAAEQADRPAREVSPALRPLLDARFPKPRILGGSRRLIRIDALELEEWASRQ